ncbi:General transcription factor 3C polypeptide 5 [Serendipita sp. 397]|nr:General transcription factor 3C polypeptide 5 [Serendipita sp. 397]
MADQNQKEKSEVAILNPLNRTVFYSIEFPGYVNPGSVQKCVQRLGGLQNISDTFRRGLKIDLPLKDNDPFAHPAAGQTVATQNLVLRIVKRRRKQQIERDGGDDQMQEEGSSRGGNSTKQSEGVFTAEIVGISQKTMRFRSEHKDRGFTLLHLLQIPSIFNTGLI